MSSSIYVHLEPEWGRLVDQFATRHISRVNLSSWDPDNPELGLFCEYFSGWMRFSDTCESMMRSAPRLRWEKFHAVFKPILDRVQEIDLESAINHPSNKPVPSEFEYQQYFWENTFVILSPEKCLKTAEASHAICLLDYWPYFRANLDSDSHFDDFREFENYALSWIKCFRKAAWENAGIVAVCLE